MRNFSEEFRNEVRKKKEIRTKRPEGLRLWEATAKGIIVRWNVPEVRQTSVYRFCKILPPEVIQKAFDDAEILAHTDKCAYFFAILGRRVRSVRAAAPARSRTVDRH